MASLEKPYYVFTAEMLPGNIPSISLMQLAAHENDYVIQEPRLKLRLVSLSDIPALIAILDNPENTKYETAASKFSYEEREAIIRKWTIISDPPAHMNFVIEIDDEVAGITGYGWIGEDPMRAAHSNAGPSNDRAAVPSISGEGVMSGSGGDGATLPSALASAGLQPQPTRIATVGVILDSAFRGRGHALASMIMTIDFGIRVLKFSHIRITANSQNRDLVKLIRKLDPKMATMVARAPDRSGNDLKWTIDEDSWGRNIVTWHGPVLNTSGMETMPIHEGHVVQWREVAVATQ